VVSFTPRPLYPPGKELLIWEPSTIQTAVAFKYLIKILKNIVLDLCCLKLRVISNSVKIDVFD
jgi:hypothetical protein